MELIAAGTPEELECVLKERIVSVPSRGMGRTKKQTETWVACRLLAALANSNLLRYPIRVDHSDRPDLHVALPNAEIGIELVECIATDQAWLDAKINRNLPNGPFVIESQRIRTSDPRRSSPEIKALAEKAIVTDGKLRGRPFMGDVCERDWLEAMMYFIREKTETFQKGGFKKMTINWLSIYDNWSPHPHECIAIRMLEEELSGSGWKNPFDKIFVQTCRSIWEFEKGSSVVEHTIPEFWLQ